MPALETQPDALAEIYARSLFDLAHDEGARAKVEEIAAELEELMDIASGDPKFVEFLRSAILPSKSKAASLTRIFKGRISDLLLRFLLVLNAKERLAHVGAIAAAFDAQVQEKFGRVEVDVYTAAPVDAAQIEAIGRRLKASIGREPVLHAYVDPTMIGGLRLQIGDQMIDASVATRLRKMRERLTEHGGAEIRARADRLIN